MASRDSYSPKSPTSAQPVATTLTFKAKLNEARGGARTYVACDGARVAGFYSLAASAVERRRVSSRVDRNMPGPVPVILLGQLSVDEAWHGLRLSSELLIDAARRFLAAAGTVGARAVVVQAIDDRARALSTTSPSTVSRSRRVLMLRMAAAEDCGRLCRAWKCRRPKPRQTGIALPHVIGETEPALRVIISTPCPDER